MPTFIGGGDASNPVNTYWSFLVLGRPAEARARGPAQFASIQCFDLQRGQLSIQTRHRRTGRTQLRICTGLVDVRCCARSDKT